MLRLFLCLALLITWSEAQLFAIENVATSSFHKTAPTGSDIPGWDIGWAQPAVQPDGFKSSTGWHYVGSVGGNSATYLGNGWVLTAAHVGAGSLTLGGTIYPMAPGTVHKFGKVDLMVFQVSPCPAMPSLHLRATDPLPMADKVVVVGYGAGGGDRFKTWGYGTVNRISQQVGLPIGSYLSNDFYMITGTFQGTASSFTNDYKIVTGDSGGGAFIFNDAAQRWELAGIAELNGDATMSDQTSHSFSGFVQLSTYAKQINKIAYRPF